MENDLRERGIPLGTEGWDPRAKSWWYGHGGSLDPVTGRCVHRKKVFTPTQALIDAMTQAQEGKIKFSRENDALTLALGNREHPGRVQGKGAIPWKVGFPQDNDLYSYRSHKRKKGRDADRVGRLESELFEVKQIVHELVKERSTWLHEDRGANVGSQQRRSSVASTEAPAGANAPLLPAGANAPMIDITALEPRYPMDDVQEMKECELHYPMGNISMKVVIGSALPCTPGALHHNNPFPDGYARVTVEDIVQGCEDLEIDYATPEGDVRLRDVKRNLFYGKRSTSSFQARRQGHRPRGITQVHHPPVVVLVDTSKTKRTPDDAEELLAKIGRNHDDWSTPEPTPTPILKKRGMIKLNDEDMREAKKSLKEKGIKPEDVKNLPPIEDLCKITPPSSMIEDPLYPEGHPKRVEQDSQLTKTSAPSKKKKKKHKNVVESSEPVNDPNSISISDAETGNEHDKDNDKDDTPDKEEVEEEPEKHAKNKKYTKEDFIAEKHGNEREPWVQKPMPFPAKKLKSKEEEHYNKFCDWMKPLFLQIPLTDAIKLPPYSKYMKDIVSNKRKIPNEEISTMLANYSFNGKVPKKLGDPDKLIPTDISLQMADKSTAIPVGVCENVPVQVTQHCLILTDFVVLEMPEDDNMSIILGRPFLNTAGAVIDCNKGKVTFNVDDKEHTVYFPKRIDKDFEFHRSQTNPMVRYKIYNKTINLPFSDFCAAIRVPQWGSCEKVRGTPRELSNLYTMICNGRSFSDDGGKISSIQQPAIRYFAYFVTKKGWSITENELNAYIEREGHRAREGTEEAEEHLDSPSDAASSSYQHYGHVEPPRHSSAQGPYYHSMYDPPAWNSDPRWE
ncbi:hypothetical protein QYE76_023042 [Lolium multiflorum]|uniref:DUF8039 domain-containing protein n=1 Tax=Lolium multiflorum TaxID=4521 RepID=A0AAD8VUD4_LOLMU|nr:hypothetical protein QYE76_023042 [Lolium multiflorum]